MVQRGLNMTFLLLKRQSLRPGNIILILALMFVSCKDNNIISQVAVLDEPFRLKFGQNKILHSENLIIGFNELVTDSRCPIGVVCVSGGHADIAVTLAVPGADSTKFNLIIGPELTKGNSKVHSSIDRLGLTVTLMQLDPYPESDKSHRASEYDALLNISKLRK